MYLNNEKKNTDSILMVGISQQKATYSDMVNQKSEQGPCLTIGMQLLISFPSAERPKIDIG